VKAIVGSLFGVGLGLALALLVAPQVGCSCPVGYHAKRIAAGTFAVHQIRSDADLGYVDALFGQVVITEKTVVHTVTVGADQYELAYAITGTQQ